MINKDVIKDRSINNSDHKSQHKTDTESDIKVEHSHNVILQTFGDIIVLFKPGHFSTEASGRIFSDRHRAGKSHPVVEGHLRQSHSKKREYAFGSHEH